MNYNLVFTIYGLIFIFSLLITLAMKKRRKTVRSKAYSLIITILLIYCISEIISLFLLVYFPAKASIGVLFKNINNVCMFNLIAMVIVYYNIIYNSLDKKYDSLLNLFLKEKKFLFLCIVDILISIIYMIISRDKVIDINNLNFISTSFGLTLLTLVCLILIICLITSYRKKQYNLFKCFSVIFIVIITILPFQLVFKHISFIPFSIMLIIFIMYYFIENPDIELLEEVTRLKSEIDKSSNTKIDFLFNLSYDLVNPINSIVSLSKSLSEVNTLDNESVLNDLHSIKYAGNTLLDSINNVLDMSSNLNNENVNREYSVVELINRLQSVTVARIGSKQINFELFVDKNVNSRLFGDINKMQKILLNVLSNSIRYTEVGKIRVEVTAVNEKNIQILNFKILDTGNGIKDEDKGLIFTDEKDSENSGVGLAVSKQFVESMGGSIRFESVYGAGTTFYISIPQEMVGSRLYVDDVGLEDENLNNSVIDCSKYKLAVVDDDNLDIKVTLKLLKKYNFQVTVINSTIDFINKIKCDEQFDLVLLDHKMPVYDGMKTVKALRQLDGYVLPKIICFTANAMSGARDYYISNGFDEYIAKPIDVHELDRVIKKFIK